MAIAFLLPSHGRLTMNHLRRIYNSHKRQVASRNNKGAARREEAVRNAIYREVNMTNQNIIPYFRKYQKHRLINVKNQGTLLFRTGLQVKRARHKFKQGLGMGAARSLMGSMSIKAGRGTAQGLPNALLRQIITPAYRTSPEEVRSIKNSMARLASVRRRKRT